VLGNHHPPQLLVDAAQVRRLKLIYSTGERARDDLGRNVIYFDPHSVEGDACVTVRGYDVPILPSSAITQAAIYWAMVAEASTAPAP
jgi:uncharacterized phosphosugar-binding protein